MGSFNLTMFDGGEYNEQGYQIVGKVYIFTWIIITNIMILNLLIALFSDSYNSLIKEGNGILLKEIVDLRP
jgi:uncharacterized membrane protein